MLIHGGVIRAGSKARNKGWRIDYHMVSDTMVGRILRQKSNLSGICQIMPPVTITYRF